MQVGEWYRIPKTASPDWIRANRQILEICNGIVIYQRTNEHTDTERISTVIRAISQGDWVLLYPAHVRLPIGA